MLNSEPTPHTPSKYLEWIHPITLDDKNRIHIPGEWHEYFANHRTIKLLYTGKYGIMVSESIFNEQAANPSLIVYTVLIDNTFRLLIPSLFQRTYGITLEKDVNLIGKWNHIEIYFNVDIFNKMRNLALQAAIQFQIELIQNQKV